MHTHVRTLHYIHVLLSLVVPYTHKHTSAVNRLQFKIQSSNGCKSYSYKLCEDRNYY